ncbi:MAG: ubiquitin-like protein [Actinomycetota bacterium]|nr:ubiquitin-like protein [Actinomycetota bacterium]
MFDILRGRTARVAAQAAVLSVIVGGTVAYADIDKTIILTVDGRSNEIRNSADTVGSLLTSRKITVGDHDLVAPAADSELSDGDEVVVRFGRPLSVTTDGKRHDYWTTELTVDNALQSLGIRAEGARLSVSRSEAIGRSGMRLLVSTPKKITLAADGRTAAVTTTAPTVGDLLEEQKITLGKLDTLSVSINSSTVEGQVIAVTRIVHRTRTTKVPVAHETEKRDTASLTKGTTKVITPGKDGSRQVTYRDITANGKVISTTVVAKKLLTAPVTEVVQVGTKPKAQDSSGGGSVAGADGLNWGALAQCESGGNPQAVNPAGYYGLYQFSPSTWASVGGSGNPSDASSAEQTYRAKLLYNKAGAGQWGCGAHLYD